MVNPIPTEEKPVVQPAHTSANAVNRDGAKLMAFLLLSRILGIARDSVMAAKFGIGNQTDAYRLAFTIPDTLFYLIAGGALSSAFIPVFTEFLAKENDKEAWDLFSVVATVMSIVVVVFIIGAWYFAPQLAGIMGNGKPPEVIGWVTYMSRIILPAQFAFFIGGLLFGVLYAKGKSTIPGLGPNVYNIGIILGALFLTPYFIPHIAGMSMGALIGAFAGSLLLPIWVVRKLGAKFHFSLDLKTPGVKRVFTLMLPVILGLSLPSVYGIIMLKYASQYGQGIVTAIDLSNKLMQAPLGIFGQSLALAAFPVLSLFYAQGRKDLYVNQLTRTLQTTLYLSIPAAAILAAMAPQIVNLLYGYGHTTAADLIPTALSLRFFSIGVSAWCVHPLLMRGFFALQQSAKPIILGTLTTVLFIGLYFGMKPLGFGFLSLPLAGSIAAILLEIVLFTMLTREVPGFNLLRIGKTLGGAAIGSVAIGAFALFAAKHIPTSHGRIVYALAFLFVVTLCGWIYYYLTKFMGMDEAKLVLRVFNRDRPDGPITPVEAGGD